MKSYCTHPWDRLKIDSTGDFQSCCHQTTYYGNLLEEITLEDIMKLSSLREVKTSTLNKSLHQHCNNKTCPLYHTALDRVHEVSLNKYPKQIELALPPTWCNIGGLSPSPDTACIMCPRSSQSFMNSIGMLPDVTDTLLGKIKPAFPYLETFTILGIAEPFYKGRLFEILDKVDFKQYKNQILFWTFSNATIFGEKYQNLFLNEYTAKTCIGFSIDAATPETYRKIRRLDYFNTIQNNLEKYFKKTNDFSTKRDWSFVTFNINMINLHEMEDMLRFGNNIGANRVQYNLTYVSDSDMNLSKELLCNENNWPQFWEQQQKIEQIAKSINQSVEFYVPFHNGYLNQ